MVFNIFHRNKTKKNISYELLENIRSYIDKNYTETYDTAISNKSSETISENPPRTENFYSAFEDFDPLSKDEEFTPQIDKWVCCSMAPLEEPDKIENFTPLTLEDLINKAGETFSQMLLRLIEESGFTDAKVYKRAQIDRRLFSKIRSNKNYAPSKNTVISFAIALYLNLDQTKDLLNTAGYALSHSSVADIIVEYFITNEIYDLFELNETLFAFEQKILG